PRSSFGRSLNPFTKSEIFKARKMSESRIVRVAERTPQHNTRNLFVLILQFGNGSPRSFRPWYLPSEWTFVI
ncbi:MAG: hypothetical protein WA198_21135, partial [Candidatus Sulfotelmatobacter sp.]